MGIGLSPSTLGVFRDCPKCFWIAKNKKIDRPRGIMASLPKGMDRVMKEQVELLLVSGKDIPSLSYIPGAVPFRDRLRLEKFRHWQSFQHKVMVGTVEVKVWGELDDLIEHEDKRVSPWDFKTKGDEPDDDYGAKWYGMQLDMYHLILEGQGLKCTGMGYLSYGWPTAIINVDGTHMVGFGWKNIELATDPKRAMDLVAAATKCLMGPEPAASGQCEQCAYIDRRNSISKAPAHA